MIFLCARWEEYFKWYENSEFNEMEQAGTISKFLKFVHLFIMETGWIISEFING